MEKLEVVSNTNMHLMDNFHNYFMDFGRKSSIALVGGANPLEGASNYNFAKYFSKKMYEMKRQMVLQCIKLIIITYLT